MKPQKLVKLALREVAIILTLITVKKDLSIQMKLIRRKRVRKIALKQEVNRLMELKAIFRKKIQLKTLMERNHQKMEYPNVLLIKHTIKKQRNVYWLKVFALKISFMMILSKNVYQKVLYVELIKSMIRKLNSVKRCLLLHLLTWQTCFILIKSIQNT